MISSYSLVLKFDMIFMRLSSWLGSLSSSARFFTRSITNSIILPQVSSCSNSSLLVSDILANVRSTRLRNYAGFSTYIKALLIQQRFCTSSNEFTKPNSSMWKLQDAIESASSSIIESTLSRILHISLNMWGIFLIIAFAMSHPSTIRLLRQYKACS